MRHFLGILLIFSIVGAYSGSQLWVSFQRHRVRREIKNALAEINKDELISLKFSKDELALLDWKNPHEFQFKGKMYDVVEQTTEEGNTTFLCWLDKEETKLNQQLSKVLDRYFAHHLPVKHSYQLLQQFYRGLYYHHPSQYTWAVPTLLRKGSTFVYLFFLNVYHPPITPPPERP